MHSPERDEESWSVPGRQGHGSTEIHRGTRDNQDKTRGAGHVNYAYILSLFV